MTDEDILALVGDELHQPQKLWELLELQVLLTHPHRCTVVMYIWQSCSCIVPSPGCRA